MPARALALAALCTLAASLAGCSSDPGSIEVVASTSTSGAPAAALNLTASRTGNETTDVLFLLPAPFLNTSQPDNQTVVAVKGPYTTQSFVWNRTLNASANLTGGRLVAWLLLPHTAAQVGVGNDVGCTLGWTLTIVNATATRGVDGGCASAGTGTVPSGEYRFNITMPPPATPIEVAPGDDLRLQVNIGLVQPDGSAAYLLGGDAHYDSALWLPGLGETLDPPQDADDGEDGDRRA